MNLCCSSTMRWLRSSSSSIIKISTTVRSECLLSIHVIPQREIFAGRAGAIADRRGWDRKLSGISNFWSSMGLYQWGDASKSLSKRSQLFNHEVGRVPSTPESRSKACQACGRELVTIAARSFAISSPNSIRPRWGGWEGSLSSVCPYAPEENPIDNIWKPNRCCGKCTNSAGLSTSPRNY